MRYKSLVVALFVASFGTAQAQVNLDCSIKHVPADVLFYDSSLRMGEQIDLFLKSKAYAQLRSLPAAKFVFHQIRNEWSKPGNPAGQLLKFFEAPENQELGATLVDLMRHECFMYGGESSVKLVGLLAEIGMATYFSRIFQRFGMNDPDELIRGVLDAIKENLDSLAAPEIVIGFRTMKADGAKAALTRLEGVISQVMQQAPPQYRNLIKREKIGNADGLVLSLDGSLAPWDKINIEQYEDEKGEYKTVVDKFKSLKLAVTLVVKGDYLLLTFGSDSSPVTKFGSGTALNSIAEFAPVAKYADRKLVGLSYASRKLSEILGSTSKDIEEMATSAKEGLDQAPISEKLREKIAQDIDKLAKELSGMLPKPTASMGFEFMTSNGTEAFNYTFDETNPAARPVGSILNQLGGSPIIAIVGRSEDATPAYKKLVGWIKTFYGHADEVVKEVADEAQVEQFKQGVAQALPFLQRFDEITGGQFLPALADGQSALVIDAKWTSKKWFPELDQGGQELPMIEIGMIWGVSDADKLLEAFKGYRKLFNEVLSVIRGSGVPIPEGEWPAPETKKAGPATLYYWPFPSMGQDESIMPNIGISKQFFTFTISALHAERLHTSKPIGTEFQRLADGKPILMAAQCDFSGLLTVARPWIEKLGVPALMAEIKDDAPEGLRKADIPPQVKTVLDVLSCIKSFREVTYRDTNATVTHFVMTIEDLK
jgi:hypothetical protein